MDHNLFSIFPRDNKFIKLSGPTEACVYFLDSSLDLLTGEKKDFSFSQWMESFNHPFNEKLDSKRVIHFFYESGFVFEEMEDKLENQTILAIDIRYSHKKEIILPATNAISLVNIKTPSFEDYSYQLHKGYEELKKGNCYQFNLTSEYEYSFKENVTAEDFISRLWQEKEAIGSEASATYCGLLQKLFLCNSPESLFEIKDNLLVSKPIKGTVLKKSNDEQSIKAQWEELSEDVKNQAELYMITDLIRNDLSRIDLPTAFVSQKKAMMIVPNLIHQYSEVCLQLRDRVTLKKIIQSLFPGGSITGAPKKRVMSELFDLENRTRGFYCGSTLTFLDGSIKASINIRSCEIDFKEKILNYQCGGGITLLSDVHEEFKEQSYKHDSFIQRLTP